MPEKCLKIEKCPKNVQKSVNYGNFLTIVIKLVKMYLFCDKTFVIRPTSNPKKLKLTKIGQKSPIYPLGALLGGPTKFFFTICFTATI